MIVNQIAFGTMGRPRSQGHDLFWDGINTFLWNMSTQHFGKVTVNSRMDRLNHLTQFSNEVSD